MIYSFQTGEYRVGIKFNEQHIPDSPHKVYVAPAMGDAHKLEVAQFPDHGVQTDKPYTFLVRKNGAKGELDGKVCTNIILRSQCQRVIFDTPIKAVFVFSTSSHSRSAA